MFFDSALNAASLNLRKKSRARGGPLPFEGDFAATSSLVRILSNRRPSAARIKFLMAQAVPRATKPKEGVARVISRVSDFFAGRLFSTTGVTAVTKRVEG